jgi:hypothetical protein
VLVQLAYALPRPREANFTTESILSLPLPALAREPKLDQAASGFWGGWEQQKERQKPPQIVQRRRFSLNNGKSTR